MTTYCNTDEKCPADIRAELDRVEAALHDYATADDNPCGGAAYYEVGEARPWRVLFADGAESESFATADEAVAAAGDYTVECDAAD